MRSSKGADNRSQCIYSRLGGNTAHIDQCVAMRHKEEEEIEEETEGKKEILKNEKDG